MNRICIIGCSGSGKTTLAERLAAILDLPAFSLDRYFFTPGWAPSDETIWYRRHIELIAQLRWIIEGTYMNTLEARLAAADTAIYLDLPRRVCAFRILWRTARWWRRLRPNAPDGCVERFDRDFFRYVWTFRQVYHARISSLLASRTPRCRVVIIRDSREMEAFIAGLAAEPNLSAA